MKSWLMSLLSFDIYNLGSFRYPFKTAFEFYMEFKTGGKENTINLKEISLHIYEVAKAVPGVALTIYNVYSGYKLVVLFFEKRRNKKKIDDAFKRLSKNDPTDHD